LAGFLNSLSAIKHFVNFDRLFRCDAFISWDIYHMCLYLYCLKFVFDTLAYSVNYAE